MTRYLRPRAAVDVVGQVVVVPSGGAVTLDALAIPYGRAEVDIPRTVNLELEDLDPRHDTRVILTGADDVSGTSRAFNLGLRSRDIVDNGRSVALSLSTDEALLQDYATLVRDSGASGLQGSLRAIVNYVLGKIGAHLEAGGPDDNFRTFTSGTNILRNSGYRVDTTGWVWSPGMTAAGRTAVASVGGGIAADPAIEWAASVVGVPGYANNVGIFNNAGSNGPQSVAVTPGQHIYMRAWVFLNGAATVGLNAQYDNGNQQGPAVAVAASVWTLLTSDFIVPAGCTKLGLYVYTRTATGAGLNFYLAGAQVQVGSAPGVPLPADPDLPTQQLVAGEKWFDGATVDNSDYRFDWQGTPNDSASTRTPVVDRPPELLIWEPGVSAWDFLEPLTSSAGFRLYSDEARRWFMIDPSTHSVPGVVTLAGFNVTDGADTISRDDPEVFATGVVVRYAWKDAATGVDKTAVDTAGDPSRVVVFDYARPYPGAGAAAAILARRSGSGRTQSATALVQWSATPGMEAALTLPLATQTRGKISSVRFALDDSSLMEVGTRGLIDILPGSWDAGPNTVTWDNVAGTWDTFSW